MTTSVNIIANVMGRVAAALTSFVFVPFYIKLMGVEAYGLIGVFASLQAIFSLLDAGLSTTINRELARSKDDSGGRAEARIVLRTLELIYWLVGVVIGVTLAALAPLIARHWLKLDHISVAEATVALELMAATAFVRWPVSLYTGALMGLRRHVLLNVVVALGGLVQGGGGVLVLLWVSPRIATFFAWQLVAAAGVTVILALLSWHSVQLHGHVARFSRGALKTMARFSAGISGITLLSIALTQSDKALLSRLLPLQAFGVYSLAGNIAAIVVTIAGAIYGAVFPSLTRAVAQDECASLAVLYHRCCQIVSLAVLPAAFTLIFFAPELLTLYLGRPAVVTAASPLLRLLTVGNVFLALMMPPLGLQLAHGWTSLSFYKNLVAVVVLVPAMILMVTRYGAQGAAIVWIVLTAGYFVGEVLVMHRRLLRGEQWRWYAQDVGIPAAISLVLIGGARLLVTDNMRPVTGLAIIVLSAGIALALSALALPSTRVVILETVARLRLRAQNA